MRVWTTLLAPHSVPAVRYAFDNWNRNGRFFPKPKDILEQVEAYNLSRGKSGPVKYEHHGEGYGQADVLALWHAYQKKSKAVNGRKLTTYEVNRLLDELDKKRGVAPVWRKVS